uniref:Uncharacterized protein n=1 Tax=Anguilla anguilla TaxID=7936 RepID=A0A0E9T9C7_ANGAN
MLAMLNRSSFSLLTIKISLKCYRQTSPVAKC